MLPWPGRPHDQLLEVERYPQSCQCRRRGVVLTCEHAEFDELSPVQVALQLGPVLLPRSLAYTHQYTRWSPCMRNAQRARGVDAARVPAPMSHGLRWPALPPSWRILLAVVAVIVLVGAIVLVCRPREVTAPALPPRHRTRRRRFLSASISSRPLTITAVMSTMRRRGT